MTQLRRAQPSSTNDGLAHHYNGDCTSDSGSGAATINAHTINDVNSYYANTGH